MAQQSHCITAIKKASIYNRDFLFLIKKFMNYWFNQKIEYYGQK
jgi:hypothetical protein